MAKPREELVGQVRRAFAGVPYPGDDCLADGTYGEEPEAVRRAFAGRTDWRLLDAAFLDDAPEGWGTALSFFSAAALHFYLPAYLIADLRGELRRVSPEGRLCLPVTPQVEGRKVARQWGGGTMGEWARAGFDRFDAPQVRAVVDYLRGKLDAHGYEDIVVVQALDNYWLGRLEDDA